MLIRLPRLIQKNLINNGKKKKEKKKIPRTLWWQILKGLHAYVCVVEFTFYKICTYHNYIANSRVPC